MFQWFRWRWWKWCLYRSNANTSGQHELNFSARFHMFRWLDFVLQTNDLNNVTRKQKDSVKFTTFAVCICGLFPMWLNGWKVNGWLIHTVIWVNLKATRNILALSLHCASHVYLKAHAELWFWQALWILKPISYLCCGGATRSAYNRWPANMGLYLSGTASAFHAKGLRFNLQQFSLKESGSRQCEGPLPRALRSSDIDRLYVFMQ